MWCRRVLTSGRARSDGWNLAQTRLVERKTNSGRGRCASSMKWFREVEELGACLFCRQASNGKRDGRLGHPRNF